MSLALASEPIESSFVVRLVSPDNEEKIIKFRDVHREFVQPIINSLFLYRIMLTKEFHLLFEYFLNFGFGVDHRELNIRNALKGLSDEISGTEVCRLSENAPIDLFKMFWKDGDCVEKIPSYVLDNGFTFELQSGAKELKTISDILRIQEKIVSHLSHLDKFYINKTGGFLKRLIYVEKEIHASPNDFKKRDIILSNGRDICQKIDNILSLPSLLFDGLESVAL